jgi:hypothetical protein
MSDHLPLPAAALDAAGLNRQHVFDLADLPADVTATLGDTTRFRQLILIGHGGRRLWEQVCAEGSDSEHPIDDFVVRTLTAWFGEVAPGRAFRIIYPGATAVGLQRLGLLAGWHHPAPFMVGIDPGWGTWWAYRAAIVADTGFRPSPAVDRNNPCAGCGDRPCVAACPAGAMDGGRFALPRCLDYRRRPDSACTFTCLARVACPVGSDHRYEPAQLAHSYGRSLAMLQECTPR